MTIQPNHLNTKIVQQHLTKLSPEGRESYDAVKKRVKRLQKHTGKEYVQISEAVDKLLIEDRLESIPDAEGETLIKNLRDLCQNPNIPKSHRNNAIGWTITHLAHPEDSLTQVEGKGTCTASVLAYDLAQENGAEFARLVEGLASKDRQVTLANGELLKRAVGSVEGKFSIGTPIERMLQASFMDFAEPDQEYSLKKGVFSEDGDAGLGRAALKRLYGAVENRELELRKLTPEEMRVALATADNSLPVCLRWTEETPEEPEEAEDSKDSKETKDEMTDDKPKKAVHSYHMVLVKAQDENWVEFRNPWGPTKSKALAEFGREILDNGHERFPLKEFYDRLDYVVIPDGWTMAPSLAKDPSIKAPTPTGKPIPEEPEETEEATEPEEPLLLLPAPEPILLLAPPAPTPKPEPIPEPEPEPTPTPVKKMDKQPEKKGFWDSILSIFS